MSHLVPLLVVGLALYYGPLRTILSARRITPKDREWADIEVVEEVAPPAVTGRAEALQFDLPVARQPGRDGVVPKSKAVHSSPTNGRPRYLLDGIDGAPGPIDRVAALRRAMRGRGLCSPRR